MASKVAFPVLVLLLGSLSAPLHAAGHGQGGSAGGGGSMASGKAGGAGKAEQRMDATDSEEAVSRQQMPKEMESNKGLDKQRERVMTQEQKETGKGSAQGQESRETRRKWWRFWE